MIQQQYTPFMTQAGERIAQGLSMRSQKRQQQEEGQLLSGAMMGDGQALQNLYMYNPKLAAEVQQRNEAQAAAARQAQMAQQEKIRTNTLALQDYMQNTILPQAAKIADDQDAASYIQAQSAARAEALGLPDPSGLIASDLQNPDFIPTLRTIYGEMPDSKAFLGEERKYAKESVTRLRKRASEVDTSYNKIDGLMDTIADANVPQGTKRIAIASAITNLARILSPGIVTDRDFANLTGGSTSVGSVLTYFKDKDASLGDALEGYAKNLDPTNPELFDPEGFLNVAKSAVSSEAPSILQEFEEAKSRATTAGISDKAFQANFGSVKSITNLQKFISGQQEIKVTTEEEYMALPSGATYIDPDGNKRVKK